MSKFNINDTFIQNLVRYVFLYILGFLIKDIDFDETDYEFWSLFDA